MNRRTFIGSLCAVLTATLWGKKAAEPAEKWPLKACAEHGYEGVPPCPVPDCQNGHDRHTYITYRVAAFNNYDEITFGDERIFLRERRRGRFRWRELADKV
jgi:hypothetical protein